MRRIDTDRQLVAGCADGTLIIWTIASSRSARVVYSREYHSEITMIVYDVTFEHILVTFQSSLALCTMAMVKFEPAEEKCNPQYDCTSDVGGVGFLEAGTKCLITLPCKRKMSVQTLHVFISNFNYYRLLLNISEQNQDLTLWKTISLNYRP
jgi:hypothetical protein